MANLPLMFKKKTTNEYNALTNKQFGTFYLVTDDNGATGNIYNGSEKITNASDLAAAVSRIAGAEDSITALQTLTTKLDGEDSTSGSIRNLIKAAVDSLETKIGTVPAGKTVVELINDGGDAVDALEAKIGTVASGHTVMGDIAANTSAITVLNGDSTVNGSVEKKVRDAIAAVVASAPSNFDTLKEISDWIGTHSSDATAMNTSILSNTAAISSANSAISANATAISANASAISTHETFVGTSLPAATSATTVIGYVEESFQACDTKIGNIPTTASASNIVGYVQEVVAGNQLFWTED